MSDAIYQNYIANAFVASFISLVSTSADSAATSNAFWLMVVGVALGTSL